MNKTTNTHPASKPIPEKSVEALKQLSEAFNTPHMVQVPADKYDEMLRASTQRDLIVGCLNTFPEYMALDFVRAVFGISKPDPAANTVANEGNANA